MLREIATLEQDRHLAKFIVLGKTHFKFQIQYQFLSFIDETYTLFIIVAVLHYTYEKKKNGSHKLKYGS